MSDQRNSGVAHAARDEAILDAVCDGLRRYGPRKLTAHDVAAQAGISRMTLYRAMGSMESAILSALTREFTRTVEQLRRELPDADGATRLAAFLGSAARAFVDSPIVAHVLEQQPELIEPYLSGRLGRSQEVVVDAITELTAAGVADGSIAQPPPQPLTLLLLVRGVALGAPLVSRAAFERSCDDLARIARAGLRPAPVPA